MIRSLLLIAFVVLAGCLPETEAEDKGPLIGQSAIEATRLACEKGGGRFGKGGLAGTLVCFQTPHDAGKACNRPSQCSTDCLARTRTCAPVSPLFGCHEIFDDTGRTVVLCRD